MNEELECLCGGKIEKFPHHTYGCAKCGFMIKESEDIKYYEIYRRWNYITEICYTYDCPLSEE